MHLHFTYIFLHDDAVNSTTINSLQARRSFVMDCLWQRIRECNDAVTSNGIASILPFIKINKMI
jgi:hypothetical protein